MRHLALVLCTIALAALGACDGPHVAIHAPLDATVIDHHGDVPIDVVITGDHVKKVELRLDGVLARTPPTLDPPLPDKGNCDKGCATTLHWDSDEATVGTHAIEIAAFDDRELSGGPAPLSLKFTDTLTAALATPTTADQRGASSIQVVTTARYRGAVGWSLTIDGGTALTQAPVDCRFGCAISADWDTATLAAGTHPIAFTATDDAGEHVDGGLDVRVGDIPYATAITVHGVTDGLFDDNLEVELHLVDATTGADLGCTGQSQGMESVDASDVAYTVLAHFVRPDGTPLGMEDLAGRMIKVHAMEDDDDPCPGNYGTWDDDMGTSTAVAATQLSSVPSTFGNVTSLSMSVGRPYQR